MQPVIRAVHEFAPVFDRQSKILILGSFPSVKSREMNFYYGHPQNRFWRVISGALGEKVPDTIEEKKGMLLDHHIAIWDVIAQCEIAGSSDSSIRNVKINNFDLILQQADIQKIYTNGATAGKIYDRYARPVTGREATVLPSTSPANAAWSLGRLQEAYQQITEYL